MWPFSTANERQAEAMSNILAENAYERRLERATYNIKLILAVLITSSVTFLAMVGLDIWADISPEAAWNWIRGK
jgi:ABC-type siderophore export system fused ATPase/permease subunit